MNFTLECLWTPTHLTIKVNHKSWRVRGKRLFLKLDDFWVVVGITKQNKLPLALL